jgi:ectoine hydroxylase-related dioxygenase (phytanoyl-CoA dioxygenase family)
MRNTPVIILFFVLAFLATTRAWSEGKSVTKRTKANKGGTHPRHSKKNSFVHYKNSQPRSLVGDVDGRKGGLWVDSPNIAEEIKLLDMPDWLKRGALEFIDKGYTVVKGGVSLDQCQKAIAATNKWGDAKGVKRDKQGHRPRLVNVHLDVPELADLLLSNERALQMQDFLFGARTSLYTSLFFSRGTQQPIHVDIPFFATVPIARYLGVWTALEKTDVRNGPLSVLAGGHKCNPLEERADLPRIVELKNRPEGIHEVDDEAFYIYANYTLEMCKKQGITELTQVHVEAGDVIIWHPLLPHGGSNILDFSRDRYSLVAHTVPEMTPVYHTKEFFSQTPAPAQPQWGYKVAKHQHAKSQDFRLVAQMGAPSAPSVDEGY